MVLPSIISSASSIASKASSITSKAGSIASKAGSIASKASSITSKAGSIASKASSITSKAGLLGQTGKGYVSTGNAILDQYLDKGVSVDSVATLWDSLKPQDSTLSKAGGLLGKLINGINGIKGGINGIKGGLNALKDFNLGSLLSKLGMDKFLGGNFLKMLTNQYGLNLGLFDNLYADIMNLSRQFLVTVQDSALMFGMNSLFTKFNMTSGYDLMIRGICQTLRYQGADPNYNNTLLNYCLKMDLPKTLKWLDQFNDTTYDINSSEWQRALTAANNGAWEVAYYICEELYDKYKVYAGPSAKNNPTLADKYKRAIINIFKTTLVHSYANFSVDKVKKFCRSMGDCLSSYDFLGTKDKTFSNAYKINTSDLNILAKIVNVTKPSAAGNDTSFSLKKGLTVDVDNVMKTEQYIELRNIEMKKIYVYLTYAPDKRDEDRMYNKEFHDRLKLPVLTSLQKATSDLYSGLLKSDSYKDLQQFVNGFLAGTIHNTIRMLDKTKIIPKIPDRYGTSARQLRFSDNDIGELPGELSDTTSSSGGKDSTSSTDTSKTQDDIKKEKNDIIKNNVEFPELFEELGVDPLIDFAIIDSYGLNETEIQNKLEALMKGNTSLTNTDTFQLLKYDSVESIYKYTHTFTLYSTIKDKYDELSDTNKKIIQYWVLASYLVKEFGEEYSIESMKTWYGNNVQESIYQTDEYGQYVTDSSGEKIVIKTVTVAKRDEDLAEILNNFKKALEEIFDYLIEQYGAETFTVTFDNCSLGGTAPDAISSVKAYTAIGSSLKPENPQAQGFLFCGWSSDINGETLWDFDNDKVNKDITLYAAWEISHKYMSRIYLDKTDNPTLTVNRLYGTIDSENNKIYFKIRRSEASTDGKYKVRIINPRGTSSSIISGENIYDEINIVISDFAGESKRYVVDIEEIEDNMSRISYVGDDLHFISEPTLKYNGNNGINLHTNLNREGYTFAGWYYENFVGESHESFEATSAIQTKTMFAKFDETSFNVSYFDKNRAKFSGTHQSNYISKITFNKAYKLDAPTKNGYVFNSYYKTSACTETDKVSIIYKYQSTQDIELFSDWMTDEEYSTLYGEILIGDTNINISDITFSQGVIYDDGSSIIINDLGINKYNSSGIRTETLNDSVPGVSSYLGVAIYKNIDFLLVFFPDGTYAIYYKGENDTEYKFLCKITDKSKIRFFDGVSSESILHMTFFRQLLHKGIIYKVTNQNTITYDDFVIIDDIDNEIIGISITGEDILYVLVRNIGVLQYKNFIPESDGNGGYIRNSHMTHTSVSDWISPSPFIVDYDSLGTAYTSSTINVNVDDDFDIDDTKVIRSILDYYDSNYNDFHTYASIEGMDENGNDITSEIEWKWSLKTTNTGKVWVVSNFGDSSGLSPRIDARRKDVVLSRKKSSRMKALDNNGSLYIVVLTTKSIVQNSGGVLQNEAQLELNDSWYIPDLKVYFDSHNARIESEITKVWVDANGVRRTSKIDGYEYNPTETFENYDEYHKTDVKSFDDYKLEKKEQLSEELSEKTTLSSFEKYLKNSYGVE